jgi:hypothetical protein
MCLAQPRQGRPFVAPGDRREPGESGSIGNRTPAGVTVMPYCGTHPSGQGASEHHGRRCRGSTLLRSHTQGSLAFGSHHPGLPTAAAAAAGASLLRPGARSHTRRPCPPAVLGACLRAGRLAKACASIKAIRPRRGAAGLFVPARAHTRGGRAPQQCWGLVVRGTGILPVRRRGILPLHAPPQAAGLFILARARAGGGRAPQQCWGPATATTCDTPIRSQGSALGLSMLPWRVNPWRRRLP